MSALTLNTEKARAFLKTEYDGCYCLGLGDQELENIIRNLLSESEYRIFCLRTCEVKNEDIAKELDCSRQYPSKAFRKALKKIGSAGELNRNFDSSLVSKLEAAGIRTEEELLRHRSDLFYRVLDSSEVTEVCRVYGLDVPPAEPLDPEEFRTVFYEKVKAAGGMTCLPAECLERAFRYAMKYLPAVRSAAIGWPTSHRISDYAVNAFRNITWWDIAEGLTGKDRTLLHIIGLRKPDDMFGLYDTEMLMAQGFTQKEIQHLLKSVPDRYSESSLSEKQETAVQILRNATEGKFLFLNAPDNAILIRILFRVIPECREKLEEGDGSCLTSDCMDRVLNVRDLDVVVSDEQAVERLRKIMICRIPDCRILSKEDHIRLGFLPERYFASFGIRDSIGETEILKFLPAVMHSLMWQDHDYLFTQSVDPEEWKLFRDTNITQKGAIVTTGARNIYNYWRGEFPRLPYEK